MTSRYVVGIDLGTTNSAVAFAEPERGSDVSLFPVPQLVAEGETRERATLPSAVYLAGELDVPAGALALPWRADDRTAVGLLARRLGERVAGRLITSSKSWLCHGGVDRQARILPWGGAEDLRKISPVAASARVLAHVREAWDDAHPGAALAGQDVVLTVPASFDEVARELTVAAAAEAGLPKVRLLEEPQAAFYAWLSAHADWRQRLEGRELALVVDVGGGTTDFSLVAVRRREGGVSLERVAVGDHLLLGGDNMDLALARLVEGREGKAAGLDAARFAQLVSQCRDAKEKLLGEDGAEKATLSLPGRGRGVIAGAVSATLTREEVAAAVRDGFFPEVSRDARPRRAAGAALVEFGLPYVSDPEVTRHLAEFLERAAAVVPGPPDAVLFNGGALTPRSLRERLLGVLASWHGTAPLELPGADLDLAVARGAASYGLSLRGRGTRIAGGAPRSYYVGVTAGHALEGPDGVRLLCVAPRGMSEGETHRLEAASFEAVANSPVQFPIWASTARPADAAGQLVSPDGTLGELPALTTLLKFGRSLEERRIPVALESHLTEVGTLELSVLSLSTEHRWRLSFDLRGRSAASPSTPEDRVSEERSFSAETVESGAALLRSVFGKDGSGDPTSLTKDLADALRAGRDSWPLPVLRALFDELFSLQEGRGKSAAHEARWLNLLGFLIRPGFGEARDEWRAEKLWRLFGRGVVFDTAPQSHAEWWTLWKRAAGGLSRQQQQALFNHLKPYLVPQPPGKAKEPARGKRRVPGPQELREMWQAAGSLDRLAPEQKRELAAPLASRVPKKASDAEIWAFGRLASREPFHGPANAVIDPNLVATWLETILERRWDRPGPACLAVAQAARLTGDRVRDVPADLRERVARRLEEEEEGRRLAPMVRTGADFAERDRERIFSESLPVGLRLASVPA